jgi:hypothetical protein
MCVFVCDIALTIHRCSSIPTTTRAQQSLGDLQTKE